MTDIVQKTVGANALYVIDESNNTLVVDQTNGRVGINNTNPGYNLTVTGATHTTANLSAGTDLFLVDEGNSRVSVGTTTGVSGFAFNVSGNTTLVGDVLTGTAMKWVNSTSRLGIGTTVPDAPLHVKITGNGDALILETTRATDDTVSSPDLTFISAKKTSGDYLGGIDFKGVNDVDAVQTYSALTSRIDNPADGAESGGIFISNMHQGSNRTFLWMTGSSTGSGAITTNYNGQDINFGLLNLSTANGGPGGYGLFQDASTGRIGVGTTAPSAALHVKTQDDASTFVALFESEDDGSSASPDIGLLRDSTSPTASDDLGHLRWRGNHSGGSQLDYADIYAEIGDPADGSEAGYMNLRVAHANNSGNMVDFIRLRGDASGAGVIINDSGRSDVDFRIETDSNNSAVVVDASANTAEINIPLNLGSTLTHYNNTAPAAGQLLIGDATAGVWDAATLTAGSNITITNADGAITIAASGGGGGGSPGGANTQVQYNNGGAFGADADFVYDTSTRSVAVGFTAAGQSSGSISSDVMTASNNIAVRYNQAGAPAGTYGLTLSDANMSWPGAAVGSSPTIMPAIDLSAGNYDFATLNGAGNCAQTHYLMITVGGNGPEAILMPDPAAVSIPPGSRWTICCLDNVGGIGNIEFGGQTTPPCPPLAGVYTNVTFSGIGSITLFTDGTSWFVESDTVVQNRGRITIEYL